GSGVVTTLFSADGPRNSDFQKDLFLTANTRHFTGTFTDPAATGILGALVSLSGPNGTFQATTDGSGAFDVTAAAGVYTLSVDGSRPATPALAIPNTYNFTGD